jgi:hypothetical protein
VESIRQEITFEDFDELLGDVQLIDNHWSEEDQKYEIRLELSKRVSRLQKMITIHQRSGVVG